MRRRKLDRNHHDFNKFSVTQYELSETLYPYPVSKVGLIFDNIFDILEL